MPIEMQAQAESSRSDRADAEGPPLHELLTVEDVALLLKVTRSWVYEHTRARGGPRDERIPHVKLGKYVRFEAHAIRTFVARHGKKA